MSTNTRNRVFASAAAVALIAAGALGAGTVAPLSTAHAAPVVTSDLNPQAIPSFSKVVDRVKPAVVSVKVKMEVAATPALDDSNSEMEGLPPEIQQFLRRYGEGQRGGMPFSQRTPRQQPQGRQAMAQGSGFFISGDGYVVTNNHVVEKAKAVTITTQDGKELTAKVVGTDPKTDLALLKVTEAGDYPFVKFASEKPAVGDWVVAIGNPFGLGGTVTAGIVSANGRDIGSGPYDDYLQIDAPINKGNSGGPTFNLKGEVVGVNTAIFSPSGGNIGLAFAIPATLATNVVDALSHDGQVSRAYLGVQIQPVTQDIADAVGLKSVAGALVDSAQAGTPAATAGLASGDVITKVNGEAVKDAKDLTRRIGALKPGASVEIGYLRNGTEKTASVKLTGQSKDKQVAQADKADGPAAGALGIQLAPAKQVGAGESGVAIMGVDPNGAAAAKGLSRGDIILEVGGTQVSEPSQVKAGIDAARKDGRKAVLLKVKTADGSRFIAVNLPQA